MSLVLIVEDEEILRRSLVRGLASMDDVEVMEAGTVDEAASLLEQKVPDLIITDIDLPGRTGLELLGEIARRGLKVPIVFASGYLAAYGSQIPPNANVEVMEKPFSIRELRDMVRRKLAERGGEASAFSVPDFIQLASIGGRSVVIDVTWPNGTAGKVVIFAGEIWDAVVGDLPAEEAFSQLVWRPHARIRCRALTEAPAQRRLEGTAESLLLDSARRFDESGRGGTKPARFVSAVPPASAGPRQPTSPMSKEDVRADPAPADEFEAIFAEAIQAYLLGDHPKARRLFERCRELRPGDRRVQHNLAKLEARTRGGTS